MKCVSRPQQLSTYALTLYKYSSTINGQTVLVGEFGVEAVLLVRDDVTIGCIGFDAN